MRVMLQSEVSYKLSCIECSRKTFYSLDTIGAPREEPNAVLRIVQRMPKRSSTIITSPRDHGAVEHVIRYPRLRRGTYFADFVRDKRLRTEAYHCVVQRKGSEAILSWTQHSTLEAAVKHAKAALALISASHARGLATGTNVPPADGRAELTLSQC